MSGSDAPGPCHVESLDAAMAAVFDAQGDIEAVASVDLSRGEVLRARVRSERCRAQLDFAALAASSVCSAPRLGSAEDAGPKDALVVSASAVHAFAPAKDQPGRVVVGIATATANVALLVACVRRVAEAVIA